MPQLGTHDARAATAAAPETNESADRGRSADAPDSRVNAHATPPEGLRVERSEFRGPLYDEWGERMREPALLATLAGARGRVGIPSSSDRHAWSRVDPATVAAITDVAEQEAGRPWPNALASSFARFVRDGDRDEFQNAVFARQHRITRAVVMAAVTDEQRWIDEAADGAVLFCEQSTWSWPAHDDAHARRGFVISDASSPYVDLQAGDIVAQLALADHVLGERWDATWPGLRERIRHEAELRVFTPFESRDDFWWLGYWREVNNWNPWILGNVVLAAVLLLDDDERLARIIARAIESLDRYVAELPADGAIDEGVSYWWNGAVRMLECLDLVERITGGGSSRSALAASEVPVVAQTLHYPLRMQLADGWYVNVADGRPVTSGNEPWHVPFRWGRRLGDARILAWASSARRSGSPVGTAEGGLPRLLHAITDAEWCAAEPERPPLPAGVWLPSVQLAVLRARSGSANGLALAAKGGTNDENHNHKDVGSFIVAAGGHPLVIDAGKPVYTAQTFSPERYEIRVMQSGWHNAPAPFRLEQGAGPRFAAAVVAAPFGPADEVRELDAVDLPAEFALELAGAYPLPEPHGWRRTFRLVAPTRVEIVDEWQLGSAPTPDAAEPTIDSAAAHEVHLLLAGDVRQDEEGIIVEQDGHSVAITTRERIAPTLQVWELDDGELRAVWGDRLTRATFTVAGLHGRLITVIDELAEAETEQLR
ncbi:heparinase II/III family protein [Rathayibacter sp. CAU 1779]